MRRALLGCSTVLLLVGSLTTAAHTGEVVVPTFLPEETVVDPPAPVQGDDVTITVTADLSAVPDCPFVVFGLLVQVGDGDIAAPPRHLDTAFDEEPSGGSATGIFTLPDALPGGYGVYAACDGQAASPPLSSEFRVDTLPTFTMTAAPVTAVAGTGGLVDVAGQSCAFHIVEVGIASDEFGPLGFPTEVLTDVGPDGSWQTQVLWTADMEPGGYDVWARCGEGPAIGRHVVYDPVPFTITAAPQPPAPPQPEPPTFTG